MFRPQRGGGTEIVPESPLRQAIKVFKEQADRQVFFGAQAHRVCAPRAQRQEPKHTQTVTGQGALPPIKKASTDHLTSGRVDPTVKSILIGKFFVAIPEALCFPEIPSILVCRGVLLSKIKQPLRGNLKHEGYSIDHQKVKQLAQGDQQNTARSAKFN